MQETPFTIWLKNKIQLMEVQFLAELLHEGKCATQLLLDGGLMPNDIIIVKLMCALKLNNQESIELIRAVSETTNVEFRDIYHNVLVKYLELLDPNQDIYPLLRKNNRVG